MARIKTHHRLSIMSNIFLSGSQGLIGSRLSEHLKSQSHIVVETDMKQGIDLSIATEADNYFRELAKRKTKIESAILCHGLNHHIREDTLSSGNTGLDLLDIDHLTQYYEANVVSVANTIKSLIRYHPSVQSIVVFGSIYSTKLPLDHLYDTPKSISYITSKHALYGLVKYLANYTGKSSGIRINLLSPGCIESDQPIEFKEGFKRYTALKRLSKPEDLFGIIELLISDAGKYITGQNINIDGGFLL